MSISPPPHSFGAKCHKSPREDLKAPGCVQALPSYHAIAYKAFLEMLVSLGVPGTASFRYQGPVCPWLQAVYFTKTSTPPMLLVESKNEAPPPREDCVPAVGTAGEQATLLGPTWLHSPFPYSMALSTDTTTATHFENGLGSYHKASLLSGKKPPLPSPKISSLQQCYIP